MNANRSPPEIQIPLAPFAKGGQDGFSRYIVRGLDTVIPRNDSGIAMVDAKWRAASPKFLLLTGISVD
jgi:hypothetical protein